MRTGMPTTIKCTSARYSLPLGSSSLSLLSGKVTQLVVPTLLPLTEMKRKRTMSPMTLMTDGLTTLSSEFQLKRGPK